jgi:hypothetical protein
LIGCFDDVLVDCTVDLSSLKAEQDGSVSFVVLPFTFLPDQHARYTLSAFTPIDAPPATITPCAPSWHYQSIEVRDREREREWCTCIPTLPDTSRRLCTCQSQWTSTTAGGCVNYASWRKNPQFLLRASGKVFVLLSIPKDQSKAANFKSLGFYVVKLEGM